MKMPTIFNPSVPNPRPERNELRLSLPSLDSENVQRGLVGVSLLLLILVPIAISFSFDAAMPISLYFLGAMVVLGIALELDRLAKMTHRLHSLERQIRSLEANIARSQRNWSIHKSERSYDRISHKLMREFAKAPGLDGQMVGAKRR